MLYAYSKYSVDFPLTSKNTPTRSALEEHEALSLSEPTLETRVSWVHCTQGMGPCVLIWILARQA